MPLTKGTLLQGGKYKIVRHISSGGFGVTYEAEHVLLHKRLAIKEFFVKDFCNRDESTNHVTVGTKTKVQLVARLKSKFLDEAVAISSLSHPNIVNVSDVFEENSTAYYVMDFVDGKSLYQLVNENGALPEEVAVGYIRQTAAALKYVHSTNRMHLDVKPGNIMVDSHGKAILIDFGASKQYDEVDGENTSTLMGRTPGYAPIEQMGNRVQTFNPATDIYALGATLYKLLTGVTPPDSTDLAEDDSLLQPLPRRISEPVHNAVMRAMQMKRKNRPQSMDEFLALLDEQAQPEKIEATKEGDEATIVEEPVVGEKNIDGPAIEESVISVAQKVDLGLSVYWADCNVGASSPEEYGDYFAWGETSPKFSYTEENSVTYKKDISWLRSNGYIDSNNDLTLAHDAARANWGGSWRMPTEAEFEELRNKCKWEWTTYKSKKGYKVTGPNGNAIFLPAAGWLRGTLLDDAGDYGLYWSSSPVESYINAAWRLLFGGVFQGVDNYRYYGHTVRPVSAK